MRDCSLYNEIRQHTLANPQRTAIVFYGKKYSAAKILELIDRAAAGLEAMGIGRGSVVTLCVPNTPSAQIAFYAINRLGAIVNLVHPFIAPPQLKECIEKTKSQLLIVYDLFLYRHKKIDLSIPILKTESHYFMGAAAKLYFVLRKKKRSIYKSTFESLFDYAPSTSSPHDFLGGEAVYLPSGGSTALPKIVKHSCHAFSFICSNAQYFLSEPIEGYTAMYSVLPIFHGFGLCMNMHMCAVTNITNIMRIKFIPKTAARDIVRYRINIITGVPAMYSKLLESKQFNKANLGSVKDCFVGGDSVSPRLVESFDKALQRQGSNSRLQEGYGLAETVAACSINNRRFCKKGSSGIALPQTRFLIIKNGNEVKTGETGEICISSPLLMLGYFDNDDSSPFIEFDGEKWLRTGDLGYLDEDSFLFFRQRIKSMIKINGVPIFPCEIEHLVQGIDGVKRAVAIGKGKDGNSDYIKLFVEKAANADERLLHSQIITACKQSLIFYAVPKEIEFCVIPLNNVGKADLRALSDTHNN